MRDLTSCAIEGLIETFRDLRFKRISALDLSSFTQSWLHDEISGPKILHTCLAGWKLAWRDDQEVLGQFLVDERLVIRMFGDAGAMKAATPCHGINLETDDLNAFSEMNFNVLGQRVRVGSRRGVG